jgi:diguanylate cyclase
MATAITSLKNTENPQTRVRKDLLVIGIVIVIGCAVILFDPDRGFEWLASHEEVKVDEFLSAIVMVGAGFAVFSWRRWTDLSRQVAEYKRLQAELSAINRDAAVMAETDDLLQSCLSTDEAYKIIIRHLEIQFSAMSGAIFVFSATQDTAEIAVRWGNPAVSRDQLVVKDCWALRRGRVNISIASDPKLACAHIGSTIPAYTMCVPMMAQGETLGILYLDTGTEPDAELADPLTDTQQRIVKTLAEHLALAVANLNLRETLRTQSIRDPLTGLFNRRYMEESLEREFRRALRKRSPLAVLMVDLDHFKRFNDSHGHEAGDAVLRELAKVFQALLRAEDIVSRYGGEEFTLILPETDLEAARECATRLQMASRGIQVQHYGESLDGIRLSIGVACYPQSGATAEAVLRAADSALYRAKERGRDQVFVSEES